MNSNLEIQKIILRGTVSCWKCEAVLVTEEPAIKITMKDIREYACMDCWEKLVDEINRFKGNYD